ncbi:hypothetical protein AWB70_04219 [Caballeronia cordobensis]|uniref:Uncharacterized protein n=1 Tax=Caballeronia cordobensis TaxID=1353886 RepID=A0A158I4R9_CABCO|nr:hypothetical protein AWB70_04219 [Caballeronia cordobensis]
MRKREACRWHLREETLPEKPESLFAPFLLGAAAYPALLLNGVS